MKTQIKYIELKHDGVRGEGRIGLVSLSKTGKTLYYGSRVLRPLHGWSLKANYFDEESYEEFWISNPTKNGNDSLYPTAVQIDADVRERYWREIRGNTGKAQAEKYKSLGKGRKAIEAVEKAARRRDMDRRFRAP